MLRCFGCSYVFRTKTDTNHARGNSAQECPMLHQLQRPGNGKRLATGENALDHSVLYQDLKLLHCAGWKFSSALDSLNIMIAKAAVRQLRCQDICCGHCILDCEIDSHSAHRR